MDGRRRDPRISSPILAGEIRAPRGVFSGILRARVVPSVMRKNCAFTRNEAREELKRVPVVAYEHTLDASEFLAPR